MKKYIKPSMEVTEVMLESPILAASISGTLGDTEIDGSSAQSREMRNFSLWDDAEEERINLYNINNNQMV